ncbi:glycosyltransferase family 39 protein [Parafrigoribacterium soli]|uniref:glycosyltransferase family 39 protein n=1 Tax=Parafrigoribacterium soli TaxID=3144663 RepID=UPI0032EC48A1
MVALGVLQTPGRQETRARFRHSSAPPAIVLGLTTVVFVATGSWIPSLWGDEAASVLSAERSLPSLFRMLGHVDAVHGTYYVLLHFWVGLFGPSPFSVRLPSAFAAGITVAGVVVLATRLSGRRAGILAGIVCLVLPRLTYMGAEARGYALSAACVTWLTILLVAVLTSERPRTRLWVLYAFGLAVCGYVFLFSLLIVVPHAATVLALKHRGPWRSWLKAAAGGIVLTAPVIGYGIAESGQIGFLAHRHATTFITTTVTPWFGNPVLAVLGWALVASAAVVACVGWRRARRVVGPHRERPEGAAVPSLVVLSLVWLLAPAAILIAVDSIHAIYSSRYLSFATPSAALLIGWLLSRAHRWWVAAAALVAIALAAAPSYVAQRTAFAQNESDWAVVAAVIHAHASPGDGVLFDEAARPSRRPRLAMRMYPAGFAGLEDVALRSPFWMTDVWHDSVYPLASVGLRLGGIHTVWLVELHWPGEKAARYDLGTLSRLGYSEVHRYEEHSDDIIELTR